ncbi:MAG: hypothetical protein GW941_01320 [Candidatus Pacebacteria bacterium]|nr:hypothetical protein [Candidatus Paceibacterota bacterium]
MINTNYQPTINKYNSKIALFSFISGITFLLIGFLILIFIVNSQQDIFPNETYVNDLELSLLSKDQAKQMLINNFSTDEEFEIIIKHNETELASSSSQLDFTFLIDETIDNAFNETHRDLTLKRPFGLYSALFNTKQFSIKKEYNKEDIVNLVEEFSYLVDQKGHAPQAILEKTGNVNSLEIDLGKIGLETNKENLSNQIINSLEEKNNQENIVIAIELENTYQELTLEDAERAEQRAAQFVSHELVLTNKDYKDIKLSINDQDLISLLSFPEGVNDSKTNQLIINLNNKVKRESRNAIFDYEKNEEGNFIINDFTPHQDGLEINTEELNKKIKEYISNIESNDNEQEVKTTNLELPLQVIKPDITLDKTNELGIKELIGFGDSEYDHSIPNRVWNVSLTAEKMNNILVAPGEEVSFNKTLGEVSRRTGYRSAYVISGGKTVLGDGGGVCQVSTTYFRAILNAGLEVTKRKAHSYRVSYYELNQKPGIDATVYSGDVDLRFINDTGHHILIRASADADELYMKVEIYGTSDGRTTEIVDHKTWDLRGAPAPAYYPTTELAPGVTRQIDWAVSGIKASFKNVIKDKDGNLIREEEYYSNYVPWSAKYLQGI